MNSPKRRRKSRTRKQQGGFSIQSVHIYALLSILWAIALIAYGFGYFEHIRALGGRVTTAQILVYLFLLILPIAFIWGQYYLIQMLSEKLKAHSESQYEAVKRLEHELSDANSKLADLQIKQNQMVADLLPYFGAKLTGQLRNKHAREKTKSPEPGLPFGSSDRGGKNITLNDMAHVLNFSDQSEKGDWANAFAQVSTHGRYLEFIRLAEDVLEILESEGIYVEDLNIRPASADIWLDFIEGERGEVIEDLSGIRDPSVLAITRARMRNAPEFQDLSLRFQKQFIKMLDELSSTARDEDFLILNQSRAGRVFIILGQISGLFR